MAFRLSGRLSTTWRTGPCCSVMTRGIAGSVARVGSGHVAAHTDRPRPPRAARVARGRRRPRQSHRQARPQRQGARQGQRGAVGDVARSSRSPAADRCCRSARGSAPCCYDWVGGEDADTAADVLLGAGLAGAIPTIATGYADWADSEASSDAVRRIGIVHAACNATATGLFGASLAARAAGAAARASCSRWRASARSAPAAISAATSPTRRASASTPTRSRSTRRTGRRRSPTPRWARGRCRAVEVAGVAILIVRRGGDVFALSDRCVHRGGSLADGELVGDCVECPLHGSRFALADGSVEQGPAAYPAGARDARARGLDRGARRPPRLSYYAHARLGDRTPRPAATASAPRAADRGGRGAGHPRDRARGDPPQRQARPSASTS